MPCPILSPAALVVRHSHLAGALGQQGRQMWEKTMWKNEGVMDARHAAVGHICGAQVGRKSLESQANRSTGQVFCANRNRSDQVKAKAFLCKGPEFDTETFCYDLMTSGKWQG